MNTVGLVGAGNIGGTLAHLIAAEALAEVIVLDVDAGVPSGKRLDIVQALAIDGACAHIRVAETYADLRACDVVVVTAGFPRQPSMTREELLQKNADVVAHVGREIRNGAPNAIVIVVTNPVDTMSWLMWKTTGFPAERIMGMAGILDTARFCAFLSEALGVAPKDVSALVVGPHNDEMLPLMSSVTVCGISLFALIASGRISQEAVDAVIARTRGAGAEIVKMLGRGSAFYGPAHGALTLIRAILRDERRVVSCSVLTEKGVFTGMPSVIGCNGVMGVFVPLLTTDEATHLDRSAEALRRSQDTIVSQLANV